MLLLVAFTALALATASLPSGPSFPLYTALRTADGRPSLSTANSSRLHNRPLYGPHNGGLVLAGDRPIVHVADDHTLYGGFLFGLTTASAGVWAHDADDLASSYVGGGMAWTVRDSRLPGLTITARVLHASTGLGAVLDLNVTAAEGAPDATLVWAFGCAAVPAVSNALGWAYDPLVNPQTLNWTFTPEDCEGNKATVLTDTSFSLAYKAATVMVDLATTAPSALSFGNSSQWASINALVGADRARPQHAAPASRIKGALPVAGATLWLRASSLVGLVADGAPVALWHDESGLHSDVSQAVAALQPVFNASGFGSGVASVRFDGVGTFLGNPTAAIGNASTLFAVFRDEGSSGGDDCCSGVVFFSASYNGIATLPQPASAVDDDDHRAQAGTPIVTKLDFAGSPSNGHVNIRGRLVTAASLYTATGPSAFYVDGCLQGSVSIPGSAGEGVMIGTRNDELGRYFKGSMGEVVVFDHALSVTELAAMEAYFLEAWPSLPPKLVCNAAKQGPLTVGQSPLPSSGSPTTRFTWSLFAQTSAHVEPLMELANAEARVAGLTTTSVQTPEPLVDVAVAAMGLAVDGLWRADPGVYVHGAMAWDSPYLGWRSEYGGTVFGRTETVASEGEYFFGLQTKTSINTECVSDPALMHTGEAQTSRFYGVGKIAADGGIYDMQSMFFDQQVHMWRWTGNATYEALLRPALALHASWASDCFDHDGDGLYSSYTNTWPTDSWWLNGGATVEETSYLYLTHKALRDMAERAGNATDAAAHAAVVAKILSNFHQLWVTADGHPGANIEEGGHMRLRADAWLYSIFLPIEAGLLTAEESAQALFYSEWGLERDSILCDGINADAVCGQTVWTSNYVPSMWSVRQLWPGDNHGLALAYLLAGLPDDGYDVLRGSLHRDMLQNSVPGNTGAANGGTDFNDCVHPLSRLLIEGLFGFHPNYPMGLVEVAPQFPSSWPSASITAAAFSLQMVTDTASTSITVQLTQAIPQLAMRIPIRAQAVVGAGITVAGLPVGAAWNWTVEAGFGQSVVIIAVTAAPGAPVAAASVLVPFTVPLPCTPSVFSNAAPLQAVTLTPPEGLSVVNFSDPQGVFVSGSASIVGGAIQGTVAATVAASATAAGQHLVVGYAITTGGLPQMLLFKLNISEGEPAYAVVPTPAAGAAWAYADVASMYNADLGAMFAKGTYMSPRPQTCGVRIGDDGWSGWTFPFWNGPTAPVGDFKNVANLTTAPGVITTPQGAQFHLNATGTRNIAFASLWDNYAPTVNVSVLPSLLPGATSVWVLLAGSTNPMQTRIANAVLRFVYDSGSIEVLELVPPLNFWSLSAWGNNDYNYATDAFSLPPVPPPSVQLGNSNRAMVYSHPLRSATLLAVELEVLSQEVVIGLLAISLSA